MQKTPTTSRSQTFSTVALRRAALLVAGIFLLFAMLVAGMLLLGHNQSWQDALNRLTPLSGLLVVLGLGFNTAFRFLRYPLFMRRLGLGGKVPLSRLAAYYLAGMAFIPTPGKVGTVLRLWLLQRHHGIPLQRSAPLLLLDMLTDFIALALLIAATLPWLGATHAAGHGGATAHVMLGLALLALMFVGIVAVFRWPGLLRWSIKLLYRFCGYRKARLFARLLRLGRSLTHLMGLHTMAATVTLSLAGWVMQFGLLHIVLMQLLPLAERNATPAAVSLFSTGTALVLGNLTFLPGGLGGTEATLLALLSLLGIPTGTAVAYTVVMRIATLWLPVIVGGACLPWVLRKSQD